MSVKCNTLPIIELNNYFTIDTKVHWSQEMTQGIGRGLTLHREFKYTSQRDAATGCSQSRHSQLNALDKIFRKVLLAPCIIPQLAKKFSRSLQYLQCVRVRRSFRNCLQVLMQASDRIPDTLAFSRAWYLRERVIH